ncbi:unnamed protein product [Oppiella nova]|uniref:Uncharacterized protein n=1 Tax=Oppiella nova TaxID=334625 RepID=A0A7R9MQP7_9ACAR|nr:unnamed protein product [Oppiella nova]CAG2181915.1 unnamed protein product [Oppiella nova]
MPKIMSTKMSREERGRETPSLVTDVRASRFRPDEDLSKRLVQNPSRRAAVVEPHVQHIQPAVKSDATPAAHVSAPSSTGTSPATEIVTRIIRTSELDESKKFRKNKTVFEQELQSGRDGNGPGCHISSSIAFDNPSPQSRGVIIKELNDDGTSKDGSTDTLDTKSGEIMTETNFQRFKSPKHGHNGPEETSWKYSMECNCLNGTNTTVRTTIDYKRITYPLTSYETSL